MGYLVVSPCFPTSTDAAVYASSLPHGYQIVGCTASSSFVELTPAQKVEMFREGAEIGGAVAAVLVVVGVVKFLRRAI